MKLKFVIISFFLVLLSTAWAAPQREVASQSVLKLGKWWKIKISSSGIYKLTSADLKKMGATPSNVRIFGFGGAMLNEVISQNPYDDLQEIALWREKDYVLFYAQGVVSWVYNQKENCFEHTTNAYSSDGYYFVTTSEGVAKSIGIEEIEKGITHRNHEVRNFFYDRALYEKDLVHLLESGREFYGEKFGAQNTHNFYFSLPNILAEQATIKVSAVASSPEATSKFSTKINGLQVGEISIPRNESTYNAAEGSDKKFQFIPLVGDGLDVELTYSKPRAASVGYLNYIELNVQRKLQMSGKELFFRFPLESSEYDEIFTRGYELSNASSTTKIWNITDPFNIKQVVTKLNGTTLSFIGKNRPVQEYVALETGNTFLSPEIVGEVANQNLHAMEQCDMVIIAHPSFMNEAERLASAHRSYSGLRVNVASSEQIYNEFSSGTPDATAYRLFVKMFYDRATSKNDCPRYLLLFGDGHYDNRGIIKGADTNRKLLTYQSINSIHEMASFSSDDYFALLDDSDGGNVTSDEMDLAVGRFPVQTLSEAKALVDKTIAYLEDNEKHNWKTKVLFLADDGDENSHMSNADIAASSFALQNPDYWVKKIYIDAYQKVTTSNSSTVPVAKDAFMKMLQSGVLLVNYVGHGGTLNWASENILTQRDIQTMNNKCLPLWITLTCNFSRFDGSAQTGGEMLLTNPNGGAAMVFSASRTVYASQNHKLNVAFINQLANKNLSVGEMIMKAKNELTGQVNKRAFFLFGDPALKLYSIDGYKVETTTIDGKSVTGNDTIGALQEVALGGRIVNQKGDLSTDFNGYVHVIIFDKSDEIKTLGQTGEPFVYSDYPNQIYIGKTKVENGVFEMVFRVPRDIRYSYGNGRILYYAQNEETDEEAIGHYDDFVVGGESQNYIPENYGPEIDLYLNTPLFRSGDKVNASPLLHVAVEDESGINVVGSGIGHDILMRIDGDSKQEIILNDYYESEFGNYKKGNIRYKLSDLPNGKHSLFFRVWDLQNNSSTVVVLFEVEEGFTPVFYSIKCYPNPTSDIVNFVYEHDRPEEILSCEAIVYDFRGMKIWSSTKDSYSSGQRSEPIVWNLKDENGKRVGAGIYMLRMAVTIEGSEPVYHTAKIIVKAQ